jgi:hypothetical protein
LGEVCAAVGVVQGFVGDLEVWLAEGGAIGAAAPNGFFFVDQGIAFTGGEAEEEGSLAGVGVPFASVRLPWQRREPSNNLLALCQNDGHRIGDIVALFMELPH